MDTVSIEEIVSNFFFLYKNWNQPMEAAVASA